MTASRRLTGFQLRNVRSHPRNRCENAFFNNVFRGVVMQDDPKKTNDKDQTIVEEIEVSTEGLKAKVESLAAEASVRRIRIKEPDGDIAVDIPLTVGAVAGGAIALAAPILALIGVVAAFFAKVKIEVVREDPVVEDEAAKKSEAVS